MNRTNEIGRRLMRILHDFDNPYPSGRWAIRHGMRLLAFGLLKPLLCFHAFHNMIISGFRDIALMNYDYAFLLQRFNSLAGVSAMFGINHRVEQEFLHLKKDLESEGAVVVEHWHNSKVDPHWKPELSVPAQDWWFDQAYAQGQVTKPRGEYAAFHVDYPYLFNHYLKFILEMKEADGHENY